jgi:hypothetical protein
MVSSTSTGAGMRALAQRYDAARTAGAAPAVRPAVAEAAPAAGEAAAPAPAGYTAGARTPEQARGTLIDVLA